MSPSYSVRNTSPQTCHTLRSVSLGQGQSTVAEKMLATAAARGSWVVLRNIHLVPLWLPRLAKLIAQMSGGQSTASRSIHHDFRLFLIAETPETDLVDDPAAMPQSLLRQATCVVHEASVSMHDSLLVALEAVGIVDDDAARGTSTSAEALVSATPTVSTTSIRIRFALAWLHACLMGRCRLGSHVGDNGFVDHVCSSLCLNSQGFASEYPFGKADLDIAVRVLKSHEQSTNETGDIDWDMLRYIIGEVLYGGHVTNPQDRAIVAAHMEHLFSPALATSEHFALAPESSGHRYVSIL